MSQRPAVDQPHWLVRPSTIRLLWGVFLLVLAATVAADVWLDGGHALFGLDGTFGFFAWYGFATCVAMVVVAKGLGIVLKRKETYYD